MASPLRSWTIAPPLAPFLRRMSPACSSERDFAYAVSAALAPEDRRRWERDLLARYLEGLVERCGARLDFDRGFTQYRQQLLHALAMWTITLCHSPLLPSMQSEAMTLAMIERMAIAIADLDSLDSVQRKAAALVALQTRVENSASTKGNVSSQCVRAD